MQPPASTINGWLAVWLIGGGAILAWLGGCHFRLNRLLAGAEQADERLMPPLRHAARTLGFGSPPVLRISGILRVPFCGGLFRPAIYLPADSSSWENDFAFTVLLHEAAHLRRGDLVWRALAQIACAVCWFNPLAWIALGRLRDLAERAADDLVCEHRPSADYARDLLHAAEMADPMVGGPSGVLVAMARPGGLRHRIEALFNDRLSRRTPGRIVSFALPFTLLALVALGSCVRLVAAEPAPAAFSATKKLNLSGVVRLRIVDEEGNAVRDATVVFPLNMLVGRRLGDIYQTPFPFENSAAPFHEANENGQIDIPFPEEEFRKQNLDGLDIMVQAPGRETLDCQVNVFKPEPIVLKRGSIVTFRTVDERTGKPEECAVDVQELSGKNTSPFLSYRYSWKQPAKGTRAVHLARGRYSIAAAHLDGSRYSLPQLLVVDGVTPQDLTLRVKAGVPVSGKLDESVPRPIHGGQVLACIHFSLPAKDKGAFEWRTAADIKSDGTFDFGDLPPGEIRLIGFSPGYVSVPSTPLDMNIVIPQCFPAASAMPLTLRMRQASSVDVTVLDAQGTPVSNAEIFTSTTQNFDDFNSMDYRFDLRTIDVLREQLKPLKSRPHPLPWGERPFSSVLAKTDAEGRARLDDLPLVSANIFASTPEMWGRSEKIEFKSGVAVRAEIILKPRSNPEH